MKEMEGAVQNGTDGVGIRACVPLPLSLTCLLVLLQVFRQYVGPDNHQTGISLIMTSKLFLLLPLY